MNYLEDFEDIQEVQVRLSTPPDRYLSLEEMGRNLAWRIEFDPRAAKYKI
jgi:hypothetical protein